MNRPSLDALRAIVLLNHYCLYMTETEVNTYTLSLTSNAVSLAKTLKLVRQCPYALMPSVDLAHEPT
jgi:hypothetical protein